MGILEDLRMRVQSVNDGMMSGELVRNAIVGRGPEIMRLQKEQLFEGKASNGQDLRPYYSEDLKPSGYFHSVESAGRYAAWKQTGISYPYTAKGRNPDAPNLYINGRFHDDLGVEFGAQSVAVVGTTSYAKGIVAKYGLRNFGLMPSNWSVIFKNGAYQDLMNQIKARIYVH